MQTTPPQGFMDKARAALARDPKRTSLMLGLAAVMLVLWGRLLLGGPASATASFIRRSVSTITDTATLPSPSSNNLVLDWLGQPKKSVERNLFAVHLDSYTKATPGNHAEAAAGNTTGISGDDSTDHLREQELLQGRIEKLKLQTTVMAAEPRAMVNGELLKEGDTIAGFVVVKIEPRRVVLRQNDVTSEIVMP